MAQETVTYVVVATHLDTVADAANATVGEGDTVHTAVLVVGGTAVESLVIATAVALLDSLRRLGSLGGLDARSWAGESTSGDGEDGEDGELHIVGLESVGLGKESMRM